MPNAPSAIFYAIQGQITLMLITVFAHNATNVANGGALGRLAQILVLFSQMNGLLIEPFFAKLKASLLIRTYLATVALALTGGIVLVGSAFLFPGVLLWI